MSLGKGYRNWVFSVCSVCLCEQSVNKEGKTWTQMGKCLKISAKQKGLNDLKLDRNRGCEIVNVREDGAKTKPRKAKLKGCDYLA